MRHAIQEVAKVIQTEEYQYHDPVTSFLKERYIELDFEGAQREWLCANTGKSVYEVAATPPSQGKSDFSQHTLSTAES